MIRVTSDTNVLVSGLFYDGNERTVLHAAINRRIRLVLSREIIDELIRVSNSSEVRKPRRRVR